MERARLEEAAGYWIALYKDFSTPPISIDRLLPEGRVTLTDIAAEYPDIDMFIYFEELIPLVKRMFVSLDLPAPDGFRDPRRKGERP